MRTWQSILLGVLLGLTASGIVIWIAMPSRGKPVDLTRASTPGPIVVYITGSVTNPGVYSVPWQSRIVDVVQAAGGFTEFADKASVNLAKRISDGDKIDIPSISNKTQSVSTETASYSQPPIDHPVNINTGTLDQLETIPGIGPTKAAAIISYREQNGQFSTIEDIQKVPGVGPITFNRIKDLITVDVTP